MKKKCSRGTSSFILVLIAGILLGIPIYPITEYVLRILPEKIYKWEINNIVSDSQANVDHSKFESEDYLGFLIIEGTNIYYPVVKGDDNQFYLDHDWTGGYNYLGGIFMDYRNSLDDQVLTIYGHYTNDRSRFSDIDKYLKEDFNPSINLYMKDGAIYSLTVFSFAVVGVEDMYEWRDAEAAYSSFKQKSIHDYGIEYNGERVVFLSTCASPTSRYVVSTLLKGGQAE